MRPAIYVLLGVLLVPTVGLVGDIVTDGQFKSTQSTGAGPPIEVLSEAMVANLNADMVDGVEGTDLYTKTEVDALVNAAGGGRIAIGPTTSFPIVIDEPGSYVLTANLIVTVEDVHAILIESDDVTLDLAGHVLQGPGAGDGNGTYAYDYDNIWVRNGIVRGFRDGIYMGGGEGYIIEHITAAENSGFGIYVPNALVSNCNAYLNGSGIVVYLASVVRGSSSVGNDHHGISLGSGSSAIDCVASYNLDDGINIGSASDACLVSGCNVFDNHGFGIYMVADGRNNVLNCVGYDNTDGNVVNCGVGNGCHHNYLP